MKEIKTKSTIKDIKVLDKTADLTLRAKNAFIRTKEQAEQTQQTGHDNFVEYAGDKIKEGTQTVAREIGHAARHQGKKALQKIKEGRTSNTNAFNENTAKQAPKTGTNSGAEQKAIPSQTKPAGHQRASQLQTKLPTQRKAAQAKETVKRKYTLSKTNELAKRRFVQSRVKTRFYLNRNIRTAQSKIVQAVQSPIYRSSEKAIWRTTPPNMSGPSRTVRQSARPGGKAVKQTATDTIKTAQKSIKTAAQTAKTGMKTSQAVAKAASRTAQANARAAQEATKFTIRMIKMAVKATAALVKAMITLVGAGGAGLALFLIVIAIAALVSSPFGIFFSDENKDAGVTPISHVVQDVNAEFAARIENIKDSHNNVNRVEIHYSGSADNIRVDNWMDVVAVFAVKTAMDENGMDVATIDTTRIGLIKSVFWDMNLIDYYVETIEYSDGETTSYEHILHIIITSKTAEQQAGEYGFTDDQKNILEEMLSGQFRPLMFALLGLDGDTGLTPEQLQNLCNNLPVGEVGAKIVRLALARLGDPYSQPKARQGS